MASAQRCLIALSLILTISIPAFAQFDDGGSLPPRIWGISPTSGTAGTIITVGGQNFQPYGSAQVGLLGAPFTYVSPFEIRVTVPSGAATGRVVYQNASGTAVSPELFVVTTSSLPSISTFSPTSGRAGDSINITGANFSSGARVTFSGGIAATTYFNSQTSLTAIVPAGAASGPLTVSVSTGSATSSQSFVVTTPTPAITSFSPAAAHAGDTVAINGTALDGVSLVTFNGAPAPFRLVGGIQIQATVPPTATSGPIRVSSPAGAATSATPFVVLIGYAPVITSFTPTSGAPGTVVNINGGNLDRINNAGFGGFAASALTLLSPSLAQATVPQGAVTAPITVSGPDGSASSSTPFQVLLPPPTITAFTPSSARPGETVIISGTNFDASARASFNGIAATTSLLSPTSVSASVPANATTGRISVTTTSGSATSSTDFTVLPSLLPTITGFTPASAYPGASVTINGANLTRTRFVSFNGVTAAFQIAGASVVAIVPPNASSGKILVRTDYGEARSTSSFLVKGLKPYVVITTSLNGKVLTPGTKINVSWYSEAVEGMPIVSYTLELSLNGGETFARIADLTGEASAYSWLVPMAATTNGVLRLTARDESNAAGTDITDGYFLIGGAPPADATTENFPIVVRPGGTAFFQAAVFCKLGPDCVSLGVNNVKNAPLAAPPSIRPFSTCVNGQTRTCGPEPSPTCGGYEIAVTTSPTIAEGDYPFVVTASGGSVCQLTNSNLDGFTVRVIRPRVTLTLPNPLLALTAGKSSTQRMKIQRINYGGPLRFEIVADPSDPDGLYGGTVKIAPDAFGLNDNVNGEQFVDVEVITLEPLDGQTPTRPGLSKLLIRAIGEGIATVEVPLTVDVTIKPTLILNLGKQREGFKPEETAIFNVAALQYGFTDDLTLVAGCASEKLPNCKTEISEKQKSDIESGIRSFWRVKIPIPKNALPNAEGYPFTVFVTHGKPEPPEPSAEGRLIVDAPVKTITVRQTSFPEIAAPGCGEVRYKVIAEGFTGDVDIEVTAPLDPLRPPVSLSPPNAPIRVPAGPDGIEITSEVRAENGAALDLPYILAVEATEPVSGTKGTGTIRVDVLKKIPVQVTGSLVADPPRVFAGKAFIITARVSPVLRNCRTFMFLTKTLSLQLTEADRAVEVEPRPGFFSPGDEVVFRIPNGAPARSSPYVFELSGQTIDGQDLDFGVLRLLVEVTDTPFVEIVEPERNPPPRVSGGSVLVVEWRTGAPSVTRHVVAVGGESVTVFDDARMAAIRLRNPIVDTPEILSVRAFDGDAFIAEDAFEILLANSPKAEITGFDPPEAYTSAPFAILGNGLVPGSTVQINGEIQQTAVAKDTEISGLIVPVVQPTPGTKKIPVPVSVTTPSGEVLNAMYPVLCDQPHIESLSKAEVEIGKVLVIFGSGFVNDSETQVFFGNTMASNREVVDSGEITVIVPDAAEQDVTVRTRYGRSNTVPFKPLPKP